VLHQSTQLAKPHRCREPRAPPPPSRWQPVLNIFASGPLHPDIMKLDSRLQQDPMRVAPEYKVPELSDFNNVQY
jgi:hypothetical protein